ncbi:sn-glycerol-3-phosphate ABC transporter ATP-binding protein UgpC [Vibrio sp. TH_r3]|uniref:ABC transporter ATP-binding protein n=1 Tax=Vibrio sp. TH_r3 TaxID=3082084 RepID=UPI0029557B48|nr:sn-glycerol-3-phosphate ABC transporter ATP-binding protein UgpC [Vibrio sp. TH_r3]MDV7105116.1 sn-glycerol-3-phosphate ABC transporter ATP-binding protein UgpC [Vibrio sp. TH_r3]
MHAVQVKKLNKAFGKTVVLNDIDLEMEAGGFTVLLGPSGCGKSTLLRLIAGLEDVTAGRVIIGDKDVTISDPKDRDIAMVFQSYALFPHMTVRENIGFGMLINKKPKEEINKRVQEVADLLQIGALLDRTPAQLSGGQRQRVAIGRALVRQPKVFLFDEPLSNLDAKLRAEMRLELKKLHNELDSTIVYVTHDQIEAMTLATKIVLLNKGIPQQIGSPYEIYNQPANVFVAKFVGSPQINLLKGTLLQKEERWGVMVGDIWIPVGDYAFKDTPTKDRKVLLGVRPEHVTQSPLNSHFEIELKVNAFEMTGAETLAELDLFGQALRAKLDANISIKNDMQLPLHINLQNVSLFCAATEERI